MSLKFGTDGVRGVANAELTPQLVLAFGRAAVRVLGGDRFLIGRDTRASGPMLQAALSAGMASEGAAVVDLGVVPTPCVAFLSDLRVEPAAMISASHNPFPDNGIKLFQAGGLKLSDGVEEQLEAELSAILGGGPVGAVTGADVGRLSVDLDARRHYMTHVVDSLEERRLDGLRVVLDCANGAASDVAADVLRSLGADVAVIFNRPDGANINDGCGSTYPQELQEAVVDEGAHAGLAFDGDADRVVAVDETGALIDGDHLLALFARDLNARNALSGGAVAVTVMTNLGFHIAMRDAGIEVRETKVGDRYVLEALAEGGLVLGGEQSGHIIFRDRATTGDGLLAGVQLLDLCQRSGRPLSDLAAEAMTSLPQVLRNVRVADASRLETATAIWDEVAKVEADLGDSGRVVLRKSGTEPLVRVMVEAPTQSGADAAAERLCTVVESALS